MIRFEYVAWQFAALRKARALHRQHRFDIAWHLTFANAWLGSAAPLVGASFVYGPVGGGAGTHWRLVRGLGAAGAAGEIARAVVRAGFRYCNPLARLAWNSATVVLAQNPSLRDWVPRRHRGKVEVVPHVVIDPPSAARVRRQSKGEVFYAGRLIPWKGVGLAIKALAEVPSARLTIAGDGPDKARLERLAVGLGISDRVEFLGWVPRAELRRRLSDADVFVFPSLHDEAGWAVVEALAADVPVVCLDTAGPPVLVGDAGAAVPVEGGEAEVVGRLADAIRDALAAPRAKAARERAQAFTRDAVREHVLRVLAVVSERDGL
jgi:glycosyltransferase involved in cell wall biosynthesis